MGLEVIESLNPKLLDSSTEIVRGWRDRLYDERGRSKARKEIRQLVDQGAIFYVVGGRVADYICCKEEILRKWSQTGWESCDRSWPVWWWSMVW